MKHSWPLIFLFLCFCHSKVPETETAVSLHLFQEPLHLDPAKQRASSASYFFYNTLRGLYRIDQNNQISSEGGQCQWKNQKTLLCQIDQVWSDGSAVTSDDYIRAIHHLVDPVTASPRSNLLSQVIGYDDILLGKKPVSTLAVKKRGEKSFEFKFVRKDPEFFLKLSSTALYPIHKDTDFDRQSFQKFISNGPYTIARWKFGQELTLKPNPYYKKGHPNRPLVKLYFIDDEMTAFRLYEKKKLQFLRRIPSNMFSKIQHRKDFFQMPMLRFDYIGFGEKLRASSDFRKALALSIDYMQLKKLLHALEQPGCPSIPASWMIHQPCYHFDLESAKKTLKKVPSDFLKQKFKMKVSQMGGNDIKKQAEFYQNQWKKHLGIDVEVSQVEQKVFLSELRSNPPDIFRKGVGLNRPTCLNALETFASDSKQNYIGLNDSNYLKIIEKMKANSEPEQDKRLCQSGIEFLMKNFNFIPLGEMHFGIMAHPSYTGWSLNGLNQLDLSQLHRQ